MQALGKMTRPADIEEGAALLKPAAPATAPSPSRWASALPSLPTRYQVAACVAALVCAWLLLPGLTCLGQALYGVAWWLTHSPALWAAPLPAAGPPGGNFTVPKILHQTWKTREIPEKWQAAQKSCVELHPDYEYRLWTDADSLQFIEVRRAHSFMHVHGWAGAGCGGGACICCGRGWRAAVAARSGKGLAPASCLRRQQQGQPSQPSPPTLQDVYAAGPSIDQPGPNSTGFLAPHANLHPAPAPAPCSLNRSTTPGSCPPTWPTRTPSSGWM